MTQFKEKSQKAPENVNLGLFTYPTLMAADILLYQADYVPIGKDQKQHLELARDIAQRFNSKYSPTFVVPDGIFPKQGAKIFNLLDPTTKMGKTDDNTNGVIHLLDDPDTIMRKFKRAVTDCDNRIVFDETKPGISNLITIYSVITDTPVEQVESEFSSSSYADFKTRVGEAVVEYLRPLPCHFPFLRLGARAMQVNEQGRGRLCVFLASEIERHCGVWLQCGRQVPCAVLFGFQGVWRY